MNKFLYAFFMLCINCLFYSYSFAQEPQNFSVTLINVGNTYLQQSGSEITLPDSTSLPFNCVSDKWKLIGWTPDSKLNSSIDAPIKLLTGKIVLNSDIVLYAVYQKKSSVVDIIRNGQLLDRKWKFNGDYANNTMDLNLSGTHFLISDSVNINSIDTVFVTAKYNCAKSKIIKLKIRSSEDSQFNTNGNIFSFDFKGGLSSDNFSTLSCWVLKPVAERHNYIKIYPSLLNGNNTGYEKLHIKDLSIKYLSEYTLFPKCSDISYKITLINGDSVYKSMTHIGNEPVDLPIKDIFPNSQAAISANWRFMGWSDKPINHNAEIFPNLINPQSFLPTSDITLYAVYRYVDYKKYDSNNDTNFMVLGAITNDGLKILPSNINEIPYKGTGRTEGKPIPAETYSLQLIDSVNGDFIINGESFNNKIWRIFKYNLTGNKEDTYAISKLYDFKQNGGLTHWYLSFYSTGSQNLLFTNKLPGAKHYSWYINNLANGLYRISSIEYKDGGIIYSKKDDRFEFGSYAKVNNKDYFDVTLMPLGKFYYSSNPYIVTTLAKTDTLNINQSGEFITDELHLNISNNHIPQILHNVPLVVNNCTKVNYYFDANDTVAYLSLPFDLDINHCYIINGSDTLEFGKQWNISKFLGQIDTSDCGAIIKWDKCIDKNLIISKGEAFRVGFKPSNNREVKAVFVSKDKNLTFTSDDYTFIINNKNDNSLQQQLSNWGNISNPYFYTFEGALYTSSVENSILQYVTLLSSSGKLSQMTLYDALQKKCFTPFTPIFIQTQLSSEKIVFTNNPNIINEDFRPTLKLSLESGSESDNLSIIFNDKLTNSYELGFDYLKFKQYNERLSVYSIIDNLLLNVNALKVILPSSIDLGVYSDIDRDVIFRINKDYDITNGKVILYDKQNNTKTDIVTSEYQTHVVKGVNNDRFSILINRDDLSTSINNLDIINSTDCSVIDGVINVNNIKANTNILVTDLAGKTIYSNYFNSDIDLHLIPLLQRGVYIIHLFNNYDKKSFKLIY